MRLRCCYCYAFFFITQRLKVGVLYAVAVALSYSSMGGSGITSGSNLSSVSQGHFPACRGGVNDWSANCVNNASPVLFPEPSHTAACPFHHTASSLCGIHLYCGDILVSRNTFVVGTRCPCADANWAREVKNFVERLDQNWGQTRARLRIRIRNAFVMVVYSRVQARGTQIKTLSVRLL